MENEISVIDLADKLRKRKQYLFKVISRLKIETKKERSSDARGQMISYLSEEDAKRIEEYINISTSDEEGIEENENSQEIDLPGFFYLIQLEPNFDPGRFKVGFATSVEERVRKHRTAAPLLRVIGTWPCKLLWEKTVIDSVTFGCEKIYTEVFRTESIEEVKNKCERFFELMPNDVIA